MMQYFDMGLSKRAEPFDMSAFHYHDYYEIYYLFSGERRYYIENRSYHLYKGGLLFINKNDIHRSMDLNKPGHERMVVYFTDAFIDLYHATQREWLLSPFSGNKLIQLNMKQQSFVERLLFQMQKEHAESERKGRIILFEALLVQLLVFAARIKEEEPAPVVSHMNTKISEAITYCNENYMKPIDLETISSMSYISPFHFSRMFKKTTGFTFTEYINTLRIREAQRLIRETPDKIIHISESVGFSNISHFNRKFKEMTTMSPMQYRKMVSLSPAPDPN